MIRRLNYTSRSRIQKSDVIITFNTSTNPFSFDAQLDFDKYNFEPTSRVFVEAYRGNSFMRFNYGIVENLEIPSNRKLSEIEGAEFARFRVKVVDDDSGKLVAATSSLSPDQSLQDEPEPLLPLNLTDIGNQVWNLQFDHEGVRLQLNRHIGGIDRAKKDPTFRALVFPSVVREVLFYIVFVEKCEYQKENEYDEESPWHKWLRFFAEFYPEDYPGPYQKEDVDDRKFFEWIDGTVDAFCSKYKLKDAYQQGGSNG